MWARWYAFDENKNPSNYLKTYKFLKVENNITFPTELKYYDQADLEKGEFDPDTKTP